MRLNMKTCLVRKLMAGILLSTICFSLFDNSRINTEAANIDHVLIRAASTESEEQEQTASTSSMSDKQMSSISMLNYMTVLSQEINSSSNSRLFLDNAYSDIVNNINPNAVDEDSMEQIRVLLNTIYAYQSIETKRERIKYIYEQNQANAIQKAIPSPLTVLNVVQSADPISALVSIAYMAVDASTSYRSYLNEVDSQYLEDGWVLDDSAAENLHESRKEAFTYMVEMCQKHDLDGKLALNEKSVESFVDWENNSNVTRRIDYLEKNQQTYQAYGKYWLVLAESYYEKKDYEKCLTAIETYEGMHIDTFRKDHELAKASSMAIVAADEVYNNARYIPVVNHYLDLILANIEPEDWMLRYFAAQTYMTLYAKANKEEYLENAYNLVETNVNYLIDVQHDKNEEYLADIVKAEAGKNSTKEQKKEIKTYNKWLEEERKVALPPVYQALVTNCDLLFALADELDVSEREKQKIEEILFAGDSPLFLNEPLNALYHFDKSDSSQDYEVEFDGKNFIIPAIILEQGTTLKVTVKDTDGENVYDEWSVDKVSRGTKGKIETFTATYTNNDIKKQKYSDNTKVVLEVIPPAENNYDTMRYEFKTKVSKKFKVINDIKFEMVR